MNNGTFGIDTLCSQPQSSLEAGLTTDGESSLVDGTTEGETELGLATESMPEMMDDDLFGMMVLPRVLENSLLIPIRWVPAVFGFKAE